MRAYLPEGGECQVLAVNPVELLLITHGCMSEIEVSDPEFPVEGFAVFFQIPSEPDDQFRPAYEVVARLLKMGGHEVPPLRQALLSDGEIWCGSPYVIERDSEGCAMMKLLDIQGLDEAYWVQEDGTMSVAGSY